MSVMIVDDDLDIREMLTQVLEDEGYRAVTAANGREALDQLRKSDPKPDVILLDLMMPLMNGWEFRAEQKKDPAMASIPVVVISAHGKDNTIDAAGFIKKPIQLSLLIATLERFAL